MSRAGVDVPANIFYHKSISIARCLGVLGSDKAGKHAHQKQRCSLRYLQLQLCRQRDKEDRFKKIELSLIRQTPLCSIYETVCMI